MANSTIDKHLLQKCKNIRLEGRITSQIEDMLIDMGFCPDVFPYQIQAATFRFFTKTILGFGVKNNAGGVEFYSTDGLLEPITINKKSITTLTLRPNIRTQNCCIFFSLLDYLAYLTSSYDTSLLLSKLPFDCDSIIIGDVSNFLCGMVETELYDNVFCFFPNTETGQSMMLTMQQRYENRVKDFSSLYKGFDSIYQYVSSNNLLIKDTNVLERCSCSGSGIRCGHLV